MAAILLRRALRVTMTLTVAAAAGLAAAAWAGNARAASEPALAVTPIAVVAPVPRVVGQESRRGLPIVLGNRLASGPGSGVKFTLDDRTTVIIGPNSVITVDEFAADRVVLRLERGSFHLDSANPGNVYVVLPGGTVTVKAATVAGRILPDSTEIAMLSVGRVEVAGLAGPPVKLDKIGDYTRLTGLNAPSQPAPLSPQRLQDFIGLMGQIALR
ncbi:MAG: FecR family protein [Ferrovibrio sp.]|uniref:FecR domain-containing protein n=1 Tax=Ferrovibrio sp. TaxID=1917215 RepID=UPI00261DBF04|nr:FecR domain-containing protein [Ferrovibrio sp.]MCW0232653.1 FecR family protein [Ferrovibrio sp.]